jgi:hypothetical protein
MEMSLLVQDYYHWSKHHKINEKSPSIQQTNSTFSSFSMSPQNYISMQQFVGLTLILTSCGNSKMLSCLYTFFYNGLPNTNEVV